ncbi:serine/threonine-protein kinase Nek10-like isoform X2 [Ostrea edulis]|uniref:serine/threonine-protein kinase Nek10-like isoform X2 n=1 Tax=Ostrea edulis TaxID=37623 RepID=UPI0024AF3CB2|nr:serine/threonine-protein kinase Nek10-like isoform X2 [Ostrea edulis]
MPTQERKRSPPTNDECKPVRQLLQLLNAPVIGQQLPSISSKKSGNDTYQQWPRPQAKSVQHQQQSTESLVLEKFNLRYQSQRQFVCHPQHERFSEVFSALITRRLCCLDWINSAPPENILRLVTCLRILMREPEFQKAFYTLKGLQVLTELFTKATNSYLLYGDSPYLVDILKEMSNIFQKFAAVNETQREWLIECKVHEGLLLLLRGHGDDLIALHCALHALLALAQCPKARQLIAERSCAEDLLGIIKDYDSLSKKLAAKLLQKLCHERLCQETVQEHQGIPILLSQLHCDNVNLLLPVLQCLIHMCTHPEANKEIRQMGGIPTILALLRFDRHFVTERSETGCGAASAGPHGRSATEDAEELMDQKYQVRCACCTALTELVMNDANAQQIVQSNGIYILGSLILPRCEKCSPEETKLCKSLQKYSFRALRFLFSMERNRRLFKRLFPVDLFEMFINIGHYKQDLNEYKPLVEKINRLPPDLVEEIRINIQETNQNRSPTRHIGDYAVFELLGKGAFGSVYKVCKRTAGQTFLAMKEINYESPAFGRNSQERNQSVGEIINEIAIIREQMKHPNIVRYYKTFVQEQKLYIVMELIEGAPLGEHFNSLKEKNMKFPEDRIWNIFMQMVLALRYLHKEKGIYHRDLTPNNIMLGEDDKVTITDFGLAKQKRSDCSKMTSVVGTILYWCPEIVQNFPYGEKADIWALGCILYQMCTLQPPFFSDNMLVLVNKIVNAEYTPIPEDYYSDRIVQTVRSCICKSVEDRPDTVELASQIADKLLVHVDNLRINQITLEKKLEKERKKAQRHYFEASQNIQKYHQLFQISQEKYDRLANLAGSGGAVSLKNGDVVDPSLVEVEFTRALQSESLSSGGLSSDEEDESCPSSECESRESSAGSTRGTRHLPSIPRPPHTPKTRRAERRPKHSQYTLSPLSLDIPNGHSRTIRDSGYSSGDPSPNNLMSAASPSDLILNGHEQNLTTRDYHRSNSLPAPRPVSKNRKKTKRPNSANTPTVTISQRRVRQISDPIQQMMHQLHKILYICQLPPTLDPHPKRRLVEKFKRALFAPYSDSLNLKTEVKKLMSGSREIIDMNLGPVESKRVSSASSVEGETTPDEKKVNNQFDPDFKEAGITYEQMQTYIEGILSDCGYYSSLPSARGRTPPLGPILPK